MGRLLGDPEVWDDSPSRPRVAGRGLVGLAAGVVAGVLVAFAVVPRPAPPAPSSPRLPPTASSPRLRAEPQAVYNATLGSGPMLVSRSGRLEQVAPDGTGRRVLAQNVRASVVVGPDRDRVLVALDSGVIVRVQPNGTTRRLGPAGYVAAGLAGAGGELLACPDPGGGRRIDAGLLLEAGGGPAEPVGLGCPVAWAAGAGVFAGTGGPWAPVRGFQPYAVVRRGASVLVGRPGSRPRVLLDARRLRAAAGQGAVVDGLALSPDGRLAAVSAGRPGRPWVVLVVDRSGREKVRIPLAGGHRPAWMGWSDRQGGLTLAVAAVDRRGPLSTANLAARQGGGYVLAWKATTGSSRVLTAGVPMVAADGFAWSSDGDSVAVSSPAGVLVVKQTDLVNVTTIPVTGTLVAWPAEGAP